jgi:hypothetical protein
MSSSTLVTILWILAVAVIVAGAAFFVLRWAAFRIARRVAETVERRVAAQVGKGLSRAGIGFAGVADQARRDKYLGQIDFLARVMDRLVPLPIVGGVGLDAVLGLVPVVGDAVSLGVSSLIVIRAAQLGVPTELLSRIIAIQCTDLVLGAVPIVGDFLDVAYAGDVKSAALIKEFLAGQRSNGARSNGAPDLQVLGRPGT